MDLGIRNRVAMVAASSKGLGRATALALAREGCRLSVSARTPPQIEGENVLSTSCDVTNPADLQRWFDATVERFGQVDILVTNTGGPPAAPFAKLDDTQWQSGVDGTLMNVVRLCRLVIPDMQRRTGDASSTSRRWSRSSRPSC